MRPVIRQQDWDVTARLRGLGLTVGCFHAAAAQGHLAMANCTANDAPFIPGTMAWARALRTLREELVPQGWRKEDPGNYSLTINDDRGIALVVASGDDGTGLAHLKPRTRSTKGIHTALAVESNQRDLFIDEETQLARAKAAQGSLQTWIYLIRVEADGVRSELSIPADMDGVGNITAWAERVILPRFDADPNLGTALPEDFGPIIDIPVVRKA